MKQRSIASFFGKKKGKKRKRKRNVIEDEEEEKKEKIQSPQQKKRKIQTPQQSLPPIVDNKSPKIVPLSPKKKDEFVVDSDDEVVINNEGKSKEELKVEYEKKNKKIVKRKMKDTQYQYHKYNPYDAPSFLQLKTSKKKKPKKVKNDKMDIDSKNPLENTNDGDNEPDIAYRFLTKVFNNISMTQSRIKKTELLTNAFRTLIEYAPSSLLYAIYLSTSQIAPKYFNIELGIGDSILVKAIAEVCGRKMSNVKSSWLKIGDLGEVGEKFCQSQKFMLKPRPLSIKSVFDMFYQISQMKGKKSTSQKVDMIKRMLIASRKTESKFIIKALQGNLRIGMGEETVLSCLGHAILLQRNINTKYTLKEAEEIIKKVYNELPNYEIIIPNLFKHGLKNIHKFCHVTPGVPIKPMLAQPSKEISKVFTRFGESKFTCEYKYDGERAQIHLLSDGTVEIYSRNLENNTAKYPDLIEFLPQSYKDKKTMRDFILDAEVVAFDQNTKKIRSFQSLSRRGRKNININDVTITICVFAFDIIYLNGESLLDKTLVERRESLESNFVEIDGKFHIVSFSNENAEEQVKKFFDESVDIGCEGLILKTLDSIYEPNRRSYDWLKLKKDYMNGMGDSLDLVPVGAYYGKGKRTGLYGGFLLACYDPDMEEYQLICKTGTGFTDENLKKFSKELKEYEIKEPKSYYSLSEKTKYPDVWLEPKVVWEVKGADLSLSPEYTAAFGLAHEDRGISLRFPRFISVRTDKNCEDASSSHFVKQLYLNQKNN